MERKKTRKIFVGNVAVGGDAPITVQSMTNTETADVAQTVDQILRMEEKKCDLVRVAVNNLEDAQAIEKIKARITIPIIADVQFDHKLGLWAVENGVDCLRINPGNIGGEAAIDAVVDVCKKYKVPIRIGVNTGSIAQAVIDRCGGVNVEALVTSATDQIKMLEDRDFEDIKISIKSSNVRQCVAAYTELSNRCDYPLHLGITEAGPPFRGTIKSAVGIGSLLAAGIGDTIRVSLTGDPVEEVPVGREILRSLDLLNEGIQLISCPTCGRTKIDLIGLVEEAEKRLAGIEKHLTVAIMGCPVNGPGEAREADVGIAGAKGTGVVFRKGKVIKQVSEDQLLDALMEEVMGFEA